MITYTCFCDGRIVKLFVLSVRNTSMGVPDNDLKHVLLLIKFAEENVSHRSDE